MQRALDDGADVSARHGDGWTALISAAHSNESPAVLQALLNAGADDTAVTHAQERMKYFKDRASCLLMI